VSAGCFDVSVDCGSRDIASGEKLITEQIGATNEVCFSKHISVVCQ